MAVGLRYPEKMHAVKGIQLAAVSAGLKKTGTDDLVLISCEAGTKAAAVFTRNAFCAAPVTLARGHLEESAPRFLLINSGNANAGTGEQGLQNARRCCQKVANQFSVTMQSVLPFSTGVIGEQLAMPLMEGGIDLAVNLLTSDNWSAAARGIMTTDTMPKGFSKVINVDNTEIAITGISKGSGMICPNMATMLAFIATDANVNADSLRRLMIRANSLSFNSITVDGDTSTNDACVLLATGQAGNEELNERHPQWRVFSDNIVDACKALAHAIVRDGEGATKFIEVAVSGGRDDDECRQVAYTVAHSPLVKTAFFASDPNVGRILAAIGRSGLEDLDISKASLSIDEVGVIKNGEPATDYTEERGQQVMDREEITVSVELERGNANWSIWTTDLSHEYVRINAEYRS